MIHYIFLTLFFLLSSQAMAAALNPSPGKGIVIFGVTSYNANKKYNAQRQKTNFINNSRFEKTEGTYFIQHGMTNQFALVASGTLVSKLTSVGDIEKKENTASGDQDVGFKFEYFKNSQSVRSWQITTGFPTYSRSGDPLPGNHQHNLEVRHLWDLMPQKFFNFHSLEMGYRLRFDQPADLLRIDYTGGKNLNKNLILIHSFLALSMKNHDGINSSTNPNISSDYDNLKIGLSWVRQINSSWRTQLGYLHDIWGRNIGIGNTISINAWYEY